jgi:hypothetical protein
MAAEDEVRQASERFYAALNSMLNGDSSPMEEIWSHGSDVSAMHPFGGRMVGWEEVGASWEQAAQEQRRPSYMPLFVQVRGRGILRSSPHPGRACFANP